MIARSVATIRLHSLFKIYFLPLILCADLRFVRPAVIMSVTGQAQDPSMGPRIQAGNAVSWPRPCFMSLLKTGLSSGTEQFEANLLHRARTSLERFYC